MGVWGLRGDGRGVSASGSGVSAGKKLKTAGGTAQWTSFLAGGSTWVEDHDGRATLVEAMGSTCVEALCARGRWWGWGAVAAAAAGWQHPGGGAMVVAVVAVVAVVVVLTVLV